MVNKRKSRKSKSSSDENLSPARKKARGAQKAIKILWGKALGSANNYKDKSYSEYREDDWDKMNAEVTDLIKDNAHPRVFTELEELQSDKNGKFEWKETARWIKFEENVETGANR